jgi:Mlc titration factor MtfA (ptsG expression regulator)
VIGRRSRRRAWLEDWEAITAEWLPQWALLDDGERDELGALIRWMVLHKRFEAARGFRLTADVVVAIAAHASLLVLGLGPDAYRDVGAVIVHPGTITQRGPRSTSIRGVVADGPLRVIGHALDRRGPVVIAWNAFRSQRRRAAGSENVVFHEFAHKLDAVAGMFDGTPEIDDRSERARWVRVCTSEYRRLRRRAEPDPVLRAYAGVSPAEFFAVATEVFFQQPDALAEHKPDLYDVLRSFYGQDPAARQTHRTDGTIA